MESSTTVGVLSLREMCEHIISLIDSERLTSEEKNHILYGIIRSCLSCEGDTDCETSLGITERNVIDKIFKGWWLDKLVSTTKAI
jgi:hypothetical protein